MNNPKNIEFKNLEMSDLDLIYKWVNTEHVLAGYSREISTYEEVVECYSPKMLDDCSVQGYIIRLSGTPIGFIQSYYLTEEDYEGDIWKDSAGIDLFIGEKDYVFKGLGVDIIKNFLIERVFLEMGCYSCIINPSASNHKAIKAYEKVGFQHLYTLDYPEETPEYVMKIDRPQLI